MGSNLTIESPDYDKIVKEAGQFTASAIITLWDSLNDTRKTQRTNFRLSRDIIAPRIIALAPAGSTDNLDLGGCSVLQFTGSSAQNFTGMRAPETGQTQLVIVHVSGAGTITAKHLATSEASNQLSNSTAADVSLSTGKSAMYLYLTNLWRQIL